ncbi:MAG: BlaI/MecI/CopY family transcriptional regulator [FCB group bacterium]|nr:BlaI/MecI/CopY family transcriptional regulator [FCB group bacterium]
MHESPPRPSAGELEILRVLWSRGPSTVREVWQELSATRGTGYTTVLKLMQIMAQKGLVQRDETQRAHQYEAAISDEDTQRGFVVDLLDRVFMGSAQRLLLRALETKQGRTEELDEIRALLDEYEKGKQE